MYVSRMLLMVLIGQSRTLTYVTWSWRMILIGYGQVTWFSLPGEWFWLDMDKSHDAFCFLVTGSEWISWIYMIHHPAVWKITSSSFSYEKRFSSDERSSDASCSKENNCDWIRWSHMMHPAPRRTIVIG